MVSWLTAEAVVGLIKLTNSIVEAHKGKAKFVDGTVLTQEHIDAAKTKADAPWGRVEDRAQAELDALNGGKTPPPDA